MLLPCGGVDSRCAHIPVTIWVVRKHVISTGLPRAFASVSIPAEPSPTSFRSIRTPAAPHVTKVASTPANPGIALLRGVNEILAAAGATTDDVAGLAHGTTVATNALLQAKSTHWA